MKKWYQSKTLWGVVIKLGAIIPALYAVIAPELSPALQEQLVAIWGAVYVFGSALTSYGLRTAKTEIASSREHTELGYDLTDFEE